MNQTRYRPTFDLWAVPRETLKTLQPGQWVSAGPIAANRANVGQFWGVKPGGSAVVSWNGNRKASGDSRTYVATLRTYAKGR